MNALSSSMLPGWLSFDFCLRLTQALVHFLWQGCASALVFAIGDWLLRRASAHARYVFGVAILSLLAMCLPVTFFCLPAIPVATQPPAVNVASPNANLSNTQPILVQEAGLPAEIPPSVSMPADPRHITSHAVEPAILQHAEASSVDADSKAFTDWLIPVAPYAAALYFLGVGMMLLRVGMGLWGGQRLRRSAVPVTDPAILAMLREHVRHWGMRCLPALAYAERISVPVVVGILRPMILLPAVLQTGLSPLQLQSMLVHELAHIRRFDLVVNLLQRCVEALLFFHPAVWYVSRRISSEREIACDDLVLSTGCQPLDYADALLRMAELCLHPQGKPVDASAMLAASGPNSTEFKRRLLRLINKQTDVPLRLTGRGLLIAFLVSVSPVLIMLSAAPTPGMSDVAVFQAGSDDKKTDDVKAQATADASLSVEARLANQFETTLESQNLPFLNGEQLHTLRNELQASLARTVPSKLSGVRAEKLAKEVEKFVATRFARSRGDWVYTDFNNLFETLKWELRIALSRAEMTPQDSAKLAEQRTWMRKQIEDLLAGKITTNERKAEELKGLESLFDDALNPFFATPLSDDQFAKFKDLVVKKLEPHQIDHRVMFVPSHIFQAAIELRMPDLIGRYPVPRSGWQRSDTEWSLSVTPQVGNSSMHLNDVAKFRYDVYADVIKNIFVLKEAPENLSERAAWLEQQGEGDLAFDEKQDAFVAVRGAKLALLNAFQWYDADRVSLPDLRKLIADKGTTSVPVSAFVDISQPEHPLHLRNIKQNCPSLVVQTKEGKISVVRLTFGGTFSPVISPHPRPLPPNPPLHPGDPDEAALNRQRAAMQGLQDLKVRNYTDSLEHTPPEKFRRAELWGVPEQAWPHVAELSSLEELGIVASDVRGAGMQQIGRLKNLRKLRIVNSKCLPEDLVQLKDLTELEDLEIHFTVFEQNDEWRKQALGNLTEAEQAQVQRYVAGYTGERSQRTHQRMIEVALLGDRALSRLYELKRLRRCSQLVCRNLSA